MTVLGFCEAEPNVGFAVLAGLALVGLAAIVVVLVRAARGARWLAVVNYAATAALGCVIVTTPGGVDDPDADYLLRLTVALGIGAAVGGAIGLVFRRRFAIQVALGAAGGGTFMAGGVLLLFGVLAATGSCID